MSKSESSRNQAHLLLAVQMLAHVGLLVLIFTGSWYHFVIAFAVYFLNGCLGMTMTYHRLLSHKSFVVPAWMKYFGVFCATIGVTGSAISWVAIHREHHKHNDTELDPHSPKFKGWFYSHFLSMYSPVKLRFVSDLCRDEVLVFQHKYYFQIIAGFLLMLYLIDPFAVVYAGLAPAAILWNAGSLIVSTSHRNGKAHNDLIFAFLVWGEGNHLNHHLNPSDSRFGKLDVGGWLIEKLFRAKGRS